MKTMPPTAEQAPMTAGEGPDEFESGVEDIGVVA